MRINKGGGIDAKGWSFKISQWMVERTKTQAIKFRNVGNEVNISISVSNSFFTLEAMLSCA